MTRKEFESLRLSAKDNGDYRVYRLSSMKRSYWDVHHVIWDKDGITFIHSAVPGESEWERLKWKHIKEMRMAFARERQGIERNLFYEQFGGMIQGYEEREE